MGLMTGDEKHGPPRRPRPWTCSGSSTSGCSTSRPDRWRTTRPRPVLAVQGPRADGVLRGARRQGFFPEDWLAGLGSYDSPLGHHPDRNLVPGVEISSGSLGHGLPLAVGTALGLRAQGIDAPGSWCWSATPSSTRAATTRRSSSPAALGLERAHRGRRRQRAPSTYGRARRHRRPLRRRGLAHGHRRRPRPRGAGEGPVRTGRSAGPTPSWPSCEEKSMSTATAVQFARTAADLVDDDPSVALVYAEIAGQFFGEVEAPPPRPGDQRRHPRAAARQRRRGLALTGMRPDRAHLRARSSSSGAFEQVKLGFGHQDVGGVLVAPAARSTGPPAAAPTGAGRRGADGHPATAGPCTCPATPTRPRRCCGTRSPPVTTGATCGCRCSRTRRRSRRRRAVPHRTPRARGGVVVARRADARRRARRHGGAATSPCCTPRPSGPSTRPRCVGPPSRRHRRRARRAVSGGHVDGRRERRARRRAAPGAGPRRGPRANCAGTATIEEHVAAHGLDAPVAARADPGIRGLSAPFAFSRPAASPTPGGRRAVAAGPPGARSRRGCRAVRPRPPARPGGPAPRRTCLVVGDPELLRLGQHQFVALLLRAAHGDGGLVLGQRGEHLPRDPERGHAPGDLLRRVRQGQGDTAYVFGVRHDTHRSGCH